jgi:hypothetical protein
LEGTFTAADTGKPLAGATVKVLIQGVPGRVSSIEQAQSDADGHYSVAIPIGNSSLWGLSCPPGYYPKECLTRAQILATAQTPTVHLDFCLHPGAPWRVEVAGIDQSLYKDVLFHADEREPTGSNGWIDRTADSHGKAVLTIAPDGGQYSIGCGLKSPYAPYESPTASLDFDKGFDPRHVAEVQHGADGKFRLRDSAGRFTTAEGVQVTTDNGQAVLHFQMSPVPFGAALVLRGHVVDQAGKPVVGAIATASFRTREGGGMSHWKASTDTRGQFELRDVRLPQSLLDGKHQVRMTIIKSGFHGADTKELKLLDIKQAGTGDFGTVSLMPGRVLRGQVIDDAGKPLQGALVSNYTNWLLYASLQRRTDKNGQFEMPDLTFGRQTMSASYGERYANQEFDFDEKHNECSLVVRLSPKGGMRAKPDLEWSRRAVLAQQRDANWDLTPPKKEPKYEQEPRYALLVFGATRQTRSWLVLDGNILYVDRNGNGDLTEPDNRIVVKPKNGGPQLGNPGMYRGIDVYEFTIKTGSRACPFRLWHWVRAEHFEPTTESEKQLQTDWLAKRYEAGILWRLEGVGRGQTGIYLMPKPADAQVCAIDGTLTFAVKVPDYQVLQRGEGGCELSFHIVVPGHPHRGALHPCFSRLTTKEVPPAAHLEVEMEYPPKSANASPIRRKYLLKERC